jgi:hypothetical protein
MSARQKGASAMRLIGFAARVVIGLLLACAVSVVAGGSQAQALTRYARITIHKAECPANTRRVVTCHENRLAGVRFDVRNPAARFTTKWTDAAGVVSFGPRAGDNWIIEHPAFFGRLGAYVYCRDQPSGRVLIDGHLTTNTLRLHTWRGARIVCDWYNLTPAT